MLGCSECSSGSSGAKPDSLGDSILLIRSALQKSTTPMTIRTAFRKAGLWPLNPTRALEHPALEVGASAPPATPNRRLTIGGEVLTSAEMIRRVREARDHAQMNHRVRSNETETLETEPREEPQETRAEERDGPERTYEWRSEDGRR